MRVPRNCSPRGAENLNLSDWRVPLTDLDYGREEEEAVLRVVRGKWLSMGREVREFEREFAASLGVKHAVAVSSATAALHLSLLALGIGPGDEVLQPAINFVAAANMTLAVGATPVFCDVVSLTEPTISPEAIERAVSARAKAIVAMHYGGYPARISAIQSICRRYGLALIEDACHGVGAAYLAGAIIGSVGDTACFSFFSNKNLATGEGGMVVTHRDDLAERMRLLRSHGMTSLTWDRHRGHAASYDVVVNGYNYRLDDLHAALGRAQLAKLRGNNSRRRRLVELYRERLRHLPGWTVPFAGFRGDTAAHLMVLVAPDAAVRKQAADLLRGRRIQSSLHYPCIADCQAFKPYAAADLPHSRQYAARTITLPLYPTMHAASVGEICDSLAEIRGGWAS